MSKFVTENFDCRGHLTTSSAENTPTSRPFKAKKTLLEQLKNNFERAQKTIFVTPKIAKTRVSTWPKVSIFWTILALRALKLPCWHQKKLKKVFLLIAKDI